MMGDMETEEIVDKVLSESGITSYEEMDSLDTLDVCLALEEKLGVTIPNDELSKVRTKEGLVEMLDGLRAKV